MHIYQQLILASYFNLISFFIIQVADLSSHEQEWLANHLAHDLQTHKDFYRLQGSTLELSKVSRLLLAAEDGVITAFRDKPLASINMKGKQSLLSKCAYTALLAI